MRSYAIAYTLCVLMVVAGTSLAQPPGRAPEFVRSPYTVTIGNPDSNWRITPYGQVELRLSHDSTRSYADSIGGVVLVHDDSLGSKRGRMQFSARGSRLGFKMEAPTYHGIRPLALVEGDFEGNQPSDVSEASLYGNATFRLRHAYIKLLSDPIDVLAGQTWGLFGHQPFFFPSSSQSLFYLPIPNAVLVRTMQVRISHAFKSKPIDVEVAAAAVRPPQRDAALPEGQAAVRVRFNRIRGLPSCDAGTDGTPTDALTIGFSGLVRAFDVDEPSSRPTSTRTATGWGVSIDALVPIIPVKSVENRGNALTFTGSFVHGRGIADQTRTQAGATFPPIQGYAPNVDSGLVTYDANGELRTIDWRTFVVTLQYYLPPKGRLFVATNYTQAQSSNVASLTDPSQVARVYKLARYFDANVFFDVTPALRAGLSYHLTFQRFVDDASARNHRWMLSAYYFF